MDYSILSNVLLFWIRITCLAGETSGRELYLFVGGGVARRLGKSRIEIPGWIPRGFARSFRSAAPQESTLSRADKDYPVYNYPASYAGQIKTVNFCHS